MYRRLAVESLRLEQLGLTHISQESASLRALAGTEDIDALQPLVDVLEPVDFDTRSRWSEHHGVTTLSPLDNLVDALPPDPPSQHDFGDLMSTYLQDPAGHPEIAAALEETFRSWSADSRRMELLSSSPQLVEALPRAQQLAEMGAMGLEALSYLSSGVQAPQGWKAKKLALLDEAQRPVALTRFTILPAMRALVNEVR
jgi:hexosaminidase